MLKLHAPNEEILGYEIHKEFVLRIFFCLSGELFVTN